MSGATGDHGHVVASWADYVEGGKADAKEKKALQERAEDLLEIGPLDKLNVELLDQVHPAKWSQPKGIPVYNMIAVGAGAGGLVTCGATSRAGGRAALIEEKMLGGDCLNIGCVPSKALLAAAKCAHKCRTAAKWGIEVKGVTVNFAEVMRRMRKIRAGIAENDSVQRFTNTLGVDVYQGRGRFTSPNTIEVAGRTLRFRKACIATGARARIPPVFSKVRFRTNATIFNLTELPETLVIVGAGPIGCELGQAFARFGTRVTVFSRSGRVMPKEDPEAAAIVRAEMEKEGVVFCRGDFTAAENARNAAGKSVVKLTYKTPDGASKTIESAEVLVSVGRQPNVENLGLEEAKVAYNDKGVTVNDQLQTSNPNIYATGDVCLAEQFTHMSGTSAVLVVDNALKGMQRKYSDFVIPRVTFTQPEVAAVGLTRKQIESRLGSEFHEFKRAFGIVDRNITDGTTLGFCKMWTRKDNDEILGCTIIGENAGELISMVTTAMVGKVGALTVAKIIAPYPTSHENIKFTAAGFRGTLPNEKPKWEKKLKAEREAAEKQDAKQSS